MPAIRQVLELPIGQLVIGSHQVRVSDVGRELDDLVENIRVHGQLEPIVTVRSADGSAYEIIAGQRRWLAMRRLGEATIMCVVLGGEVDKTTAQALSLSENLVRRPISARDLIEACTRLYYRFGSARLVARELGLPYHQVRNYVKFDRLAPVLKTAVEAGRLSVKTALEIQDHCGRDRFPSRPMDEIIRDMADMTAAQRSHYLRTAGTNDETAAARRTPPGRVRQIIVTLSEDDHARLQELASCRNLTQDRTAAKIIHAYLKQAPARRAG